MTRRAPCQSARIAAALYLLALSVPAVMPLLAGAGHAAFHFGEQLQSVRALQSVMAGHSQPSAVAAGSTLHSHEFGKQDHPHDDGSGLGDMVPEAVESSARWSHTHRSGSESHSHAQIVDFALHAVGEAASMELEPVAGPAPWVDNHLPPSNTTATAVLSDFVAVWEVRSTVSTSTPPPPVPPPKA